MSEQYLTEQRFAQFDLPEPLLRGLREAGLERCTPIQAEALPLLLAGQDVAGQAQTGTGKTATFLVACFTYLERNPCPEGRVHTQPRAIMLAPTRELALQIFKDAESLGRHMGYKLAVVYGGKDYAKQRQILESGVDILIGTPGRLIDYYKQKVFDLNAIQVLVLDEADRMFDLGFIRDIRFVLRRMPDPEQRLNMLFSATLSLRVNELAYEHMNNPQVVKIESAHLTVDRVEQQVLFPSNREKIPLLLGLLSRIGAVRTLVFVNTKQAAETVETWLRGNGYDAGVLSGDVPQPKRERLLQKFKSGDVPILVATDVAARGLHIPDVSHVINFDLPQDPEDYVHRVGRTARAGASGDAISFACETYAISLMDIEAFIGRSIPVTKIDTSWLVEPKPPAKREHRSRRAIHKDRQTEKKVVTNKAAPKHRHGKSSHKEPARKKPVEDDANKRPAAKAGPKRRIPETPAVG